MTLVDRVALLVASVLIIHPHTARAQSAEAEVLFRDGRTLIKQGKLSAGCDKLDASAKLESSVGTYLNLGDCREKQGQLASAWAAFRKAEAIAKRAGNDEKRQSEAGKRAFKLEPQLSTLEIDVSHAVDGLAIRRNGVTLDAATWNTALPLDPGSYVIIADAPGYSPWSTTVELTSKNRRQVISVPALEHTQVVRAPEPPPAAAPPPPTTIITPPPPPIAPVELVTMRHSRTWSGTRKVSALFAIVGAGAIGTGIYFGLQAQDQQDQANQRCPLTVCADSEGLRLNNAAKTSATRANILYAAGGAAVAAAVVMWLVGAPSDEIVVRPTMSDHQVGLSLAGGF
ncbi:MAG: hypothetical protein JWO36_5004 [Myxococcales bacterium]|nr:hypothetical protein [Myxococcales bacterium]